MQGVMKIIRPLGVHSVPAVFAGLDDAGVVKVAFGYKIMRRTRVPGKPGRLFSELGQKMFRPEVEDPVHRVQAESVYMEIPEPVKRVADKEIPYRPAVPAVVIYSLAPGGAVPVGKIRPVTSEIVPFRAEMVINHVEDHGQSGFMAGVYELFEFPRAAVGSLRRVRIGAVITPVPAARKLRDGHKFHRVDPQFFQVAQSFPDPGEAAPRRESTGVELVNYHFFRRYAFPAPVFPFKSGMIQDLGRPVYALRLKSGSRIRAFPLPVNDIFIKRALAYTGSEDLPVTLPVFFHGEGAGPAGNKFYRHRAGGRRPDPEDGSALSGDGADGSGGKTFHAFPSGGGTLLTSGHAGSRRRRSSLAGTKAHS